MTSLRFIRLSLSMGALMLASPALSQASGLDALRTSPQPPASSAGQYSNPDGNIARRDRLSRARTHIERGNFRQAHRLLTRSTLPSSERSYLLAIAEANLGNYAAAGQSFANSLDLDPHNVPARVGLALIDIRMGRIDAARTHLDVIERRQALCANSCDNAGTLDSGAATIRRFLDS